MVLAESNINWTEKVRKEAQMAVQMRCGQGQIVLSSTKLKKVGYLPCGTSLITIGRITVRIVKHGKDDMVIFT